MITLITGAPGAGKSAALVSLLQQLSKGRAIYAHGIPDLKVEHQPLDNPNQWHTDVPDGSIIVIDEVQTVWRPRGPGQGVPPDIQALETHRHRGIDFYIVTQSPRLVHTNVRALVGRHVHLRDVGFLGRYWYEWPECAENASASWKQAPIRKRYKLPAAIFGQYKSASVHVKPVRSFPWMLVVAVFALVATAGLGLYVARAISQKASGAGDFKPTPATAIQPGQVAGAVHGKSVSVEVSGALPDVVPGAPGPYQSQQFTPVVPAVPESAPAYDHLRVVVNMPRVAGGICGPSGCKCYSEQGTVIAMDGADCRRLINAPMYDPWREQLASRSQGGAAVSVPARLGGPSPVDPPSKPPAPASGASQGMRSLPSPGALHFPSGSSSS